MSGLSASMPPRSLPAPERPPVENCRIMPGQCWRRPSCSPANFSGSEEEPWSSLRTWRCARVAPASNASWVDSTCSAMVIGTAGLFSFRGREPVIATVMMHGLRSDIEEHRLLLALKVHREPIDRLFLPLLKTRQQGLAPFFLLNQPQHRVFRVGLGLV